MFSDQHPFYLGTPFGIVGQVWRMKRPGRQIIATGIASFLITVLTIPVGGTLGISAKDITNILRRDIDMTTAEGDGGDPTEGIAARRRAI